MIYNLLSNTIDFHSIFFIQHIYLHSIFTFLEARTSILIFYRISSKLETMTISMMIKTTVGHTADLIKDILLTVLISLSQGGIAELKKQKEPYIRGVSLFLLLLGSGVLSQQNI